MATQQYFDAFMIDQNSKDMQTLITKHNVKVMETPREILLEVLKAWDKVAEKYTKENAYFAKVYASQKAWAERIVPYRRIAHPPYDLSADYYWGKLNPYKVEKAGKQLLLLRRKLRRKPRRRSNELHSLRKAILCPSLFPPGVRDGRRDFSEIS